MSPRSSFIWDTFGGLREKREFLEKKKGKRNWDEEEAEKRLKIDLT